MKRRRGESESISEFDPNQDVSSGVSDKGVNLIKVVPASMSRKKRSRILRESQREMKNILKSTAPRVYTENLPTRGQRYESRTSRKKAPRNGDSDVASKTDSPPSLQQIVEVDLREYSSPVSSPPETEILDAGKPFTAPSVVSVHRNLRKGSPANYSVPDMYKRGPSVRQKSWEDSKRRSKTPTLPEQYHTGAGKAQTRITKLEKENAILKEENSTLRDQVDELCSRIGEAGSNELEATTFKDDRFFENGFVHLNKMIRDFVLEFLQTKFSSPFSPSRVPHKIKEVSNREGTEWQRYLKGGKNRKLLQAIAHRYISFYLVEKILADPIFRHNPQLQNAFSTIQKTLAEQDPDICNRWSTRTMQELRSTLPEPPLADFVVDWKSKELFKDTRVLWIKRNEAKEIERLRKIIGYALKLATELHKLPHAIKYAFSRGDWDKLPRDIDTQPENEVYINVHSRGSHPQYMTVFPGVLKQFGHSDAGEEEDTGIVYLPLQLSTYVQVYEP